MNIHVTDLTPTQIRSIERSARFKSLIETKAAELAARKMTSALDDLRVVALETPLMHRTPTIREIPPEAMPAETDPPTNPHWIAVVANPPVREYPSIIEIQKAVCAHYGVRLAEMLSARRSASIARPRQVAYYLCKKMTLCSLPAIGRRFGGRDHSSVHHGVHQIKLRMQLDASFAAEVNGLEAQIQ